MLQAFHPSFEDILKCQLKWRWTEPDHAQFSQEELDQIKPLVEPDAKQVHQLLLKSWDDYSLVPDQFVSIVEQSTKDQKTSSIVAWLQKTVPTEEPIFFISWDDRNCVSCSRDLFVSRWDDFCYPSSDDVLISPQSMNWLLYYFHEEVFYFGVRNGVD